MDSAQKPTFFEKINLFFRDVWSEMKKVSWLTNQDLLKYTAIVVAATIVAAIFLGGLDYLFTTALKAVIFR